VYELLSKTQNYEFFELIMHDLYDNSSFIVIRVMACK